MRADWIMVLTAWAMIGVALGHFWEIGYLLMAPLFAVFAIGVLFVAFVPILMVGKNAVEGWIR